MKKEYTTPRAERLAFDYTNAVLASNEKHNAGVGNGCKDHPVFGNLPKQGCKKH